VKKVLICIGLGALIIGAVAWTWTRTAEHAPELADGLYVKCTKPDCGHFFVIPWAESRTYPRGPKGEGFRCPKCTRFAGQIAARCERCQEWLVASKTGGRGTGCPKCDPVPPQP
jgi:hypothetical protein